MHKSVRRFLANNRGRIEEAKRLMDEAGDAKAAMAAARACAVFTNAQALLLTGTEASKARLS